MSCCCRIGRKDRALILERAATTIGRPGTVSNVFVEFDEDHAGHHCVFFQILLTDSAVEALKLGPVTRAIEDWLRDVCGFDRDIELPTHSFVYHNYRGETENSQMTRDRWGS